tara:strand:+ start:967 stop:1113 length:147 start_codon:yes stop_codon:yes gene_type:complete
MVEIMEKILDIAMILVMISCIYGSYAILRIWNVLVAPDLQKILRERKE